jgi:arabinofuranosyltransferase
VSASTEPDHTVVGTRPSFSIRRDDVWALLPCVAFWTVFVWRGSSVRSGRRSFTLFDDAMISMRYAQTFAHGDGLVWYPGAPKVEGYTNFLWTLLMSAFQKAGLGGSGTSLAIMVVGAACIAGTALIGAGIVRQLGARSRWAPPLAVLAVGLCYPLVFWALRGMEVGLVTLITIAGCAIALSLAHRIPDAPLLRDRRVLGLAALFVVGVLTRDDFVIVVAAIALWLGVALRSRRGWQIAAILVLVVVATMGLHTVFREAYYGSALPNTYVLKMTGTPLTRRLERGLLAGFAAFLIGYLAALVLVVVAIVARGRAARVFRRDVALLIAVAASLGAYSAYAGGDAWERMDIANRYLVPGLVAVLLAAVASADRITARWQEDVAHRRREIPVLLVAFGVAAFAGPLVPSAVEYGSASVSAGRIATAIALTLVFVGVAVGLATRPSGSAAGFSMAVLALLALTPTVGLGLHPGQLWLDNNAAFANADNHMVTMGTTLRAVSRPDATIAVVWAGAPPYYAERPTIDLLGKNDPVIARAPTRGVRPGHNKWDYAYSIGQLKPDVVAQLWSNTTEDIAQLRGWGYIPVKPRAMADQTWWVRADSQNLRWDRLVRLP